MPWKWVESHHISTCLCVCCEKADVCKSTVPQNYLHSASKLSTQCLKTVYTVPQNCLHSASKLSTQCLKTIYTVPQNYLHSASKLSTQCLKTIYTEPQNYLHSASKLSTQCAFSNTTTRGSEYFLICPVNWCYYRRFGKMEQNIKIYIIVKITFVWYFAI